MTSEFEHSQRLVQFDFETKHKWIRGFVKAQPRELTKSISLIQNYLSFLFIAKCKFLNNAAHEEKCLLFCSHTNLLLCLPKKNIVLMNHNARRKNIKKVQNSVVEDCSSVLSHPLHAMQMIGSSKDYGVHTHNKWCTQLVEYPDSLPWKICLSYDLKLLYSICIVLPHSCMRWYIWITAFLYSWCLSVGLLRYPLPLTVLGN